MFILIDFDLSQPKAGATYIWEQRTYIFLVQVGKEDTLGLVHIFLEGVMPVFSLNKTAVNWTKHYKLSKSFNKTIMFAYWMFFRSYPPLNNHINKQHNIINIIIPSPLLLINFIYKHVMGKQKKNLYNLYNSHIYSDTVWPHSTSNTWYPTLQLKEQLKNQF